MSFYWSADCTSALNEYVAGGVTHLEIARLLNERFNTNFNRSSVGKKLERLRTPKIGRVASTFWPEPIKARLVELCNAEIPVSRTDMADIINKEFGCNYSRNAIIGCCHRLGLSGKKPSSSANKRPRACAPRKPRIAKVEKPKDDLPLLRCVGLEPLHVSFADLHAGMCKQAYGDDPAIFTFCGNPQKSKSPYCGYHHGINYQRLEPAVRQGRKYHGTDFARRSA